MVSAENAAARFPLALSPARLASFVYLPGTAHCGVLAQGVIFIFIFLENIFYRNIFSISQFTVLYLYRPAGGGRGPAARQGGGRLPNAV